MPHETVTGVALRLDERRRAQLLQTVLLDTPSVEDVVALGMRPDAMYMPLRARTRDGGDLAALERALLHGQHHGDIVALGVVGGDLAGIVSRRPALDSQHDADAIVGVGHCVRPTELSLAFLVATRALETAFAFGRAGVFALDDLGLRPAVIAERDLGDTLVVRYLAPLSADTDTLRSTLLCWFEHGMRMEETARALHVHVNSLRHRLRRYEALVGVDLRNTEVLLEVFWALQFDAAQR